MGITERKNSLLVFVFGGIGITAIPIFLDVGFWENIIKPIGYIVMFIGIVYFIAGDSLLKIFKIGNKKYKDKTPEEIIKIKKQEFENKLQEEENKIKLQKKKLELEIQKAKIEKIRATTNELKGTTKSKMPDVLGNLEGFMIKPK